MPFVSIRKASPHNVTVWTDLGPRNMSNTWTTHTQTYTSHIPHFGKFYFWFIEECPFSQALTSQWPIVRVRIPNFVLTLFMLHIRFYTYRTYRIHTHTHAYTRTRSRSLPTSSSQTKSRNRRWEVESFQEDVKQWAPPSPVTSKCTDHLRKFVKVALLPKRGV